MNNGTYLQSSGRSPVITVLRHRYQQGLAINQGKLQSMLETTLDWPHVSRVGGCIRSRCRTLVIKREADHSLAEYSVACMRKPWHCRL